MDTLKQYTIMVITLHIKLIQSTRLSYSKDCLHTESCKILLNIFQTMIIATIYVFVSDTTL